MGQTRKKARQKTERRWISGKKLGTSSSLLQALKGQRGGEGEKEESAHMHSHTQQHPLLHFALQNHCAAFILTHLCA